MSEDSAQAAEGPLDLPMTKHPTWMLLRSLQQIRTRVLYANAMLAEIEVERKALHKMLRSEPWLHDYLGTSVCGHLFGLTVEMESEVFNMDVALAKMNEIVTHFDETTHRGY